jgi:hypothetical protein
LAPYANKHKEIKKRYDSTSGLMLDNWSLFQDVQIVPEAGERKPDNVL